jgi:hypothetical protein
MARKDEIDVLLKAVAPLFRSIATEAQEAADELGGTDWARAHLVRSASVNQVSGTARWRMVGDGIVARQRELPAGLELSTTDEEQNQGRYYLRAPTLAFVLTVRRKPHREDDAPKALQLQIQGVLEEAPVAYDDNLVVYLAVPPLGKEPRFDVVAHDEVIASHRLHDLIDGGDADKDAGASKPKQMPRRNAPGPKVKSAFDEEVAEEEASSPEK